MFSDWAVTFRGVGVRVRVKLGLTGAVGGARAAVASAVEGRVFGTGSSAGEGSVGEAVAGGE
jgi:hypothetical protein